MIDYLETSGNLRKPAAAVSGRFPDFFYQQKQIWKKNIFTNKKIWKPAGNLRGRFPEVSSRFPDNPSLTDHTVFSKIFQATSKNILKKLGVQKWVEQGHKRCVES